MTEETDFQTVLHVLERVASSGITPEDGAALLDVGTGPFVDYCQRELLDDMVSRGHATCKVVRGAYGSGKSHLTDLLRSRALSLGYLVAKTDLSQGVSFEDPQGLVRHVVENLEASNGTTRVRGLPAVLHYAASTTGYFDEGAGRRQLPHTGYARAISFLDNSRYRTLEERELLERFLLGERIPTSDFVARGMRGIKNPLNNRNAESVLRTIVAVMRPLGFKGLVLLFDENESAFQFRGSHPPARVVKAANFLRRWVDGCASGRLAGTLAVFTVLPGFVENCGLAYPALAQRLEEPTAGVGPWRWPLLDLPSIQAGVTPEDFVDGLADKLLALVKNHSAPKRSELVVLGRRVLGRHAGSEYRRFVTREMAGSVLAKVGR